MRRRFTTQIILALSVIALVSFSQPYFSWASSPPYAQSGATLYYDIEGGSIAFFGGVNGTVIYQVTNVSGTTMTVLRNQTVAEGTEGDVPTTFTNSTFVDNVLEPKIFPAIPVQNLTSSTIEFQNETCSRVGNSTATTPMGNFNAVEFQTRAPNGTVEDFWFDRNTGVLVEASAPDSGSIIQLYSSNFVTPANIPNPIFQSLPFIIFFVVIWAGFLGLFFWLRRHYSSKAKAPPPQKTAAKKSKIGYSASAHF